MGRVESRQLTHKGLELEGLFYNSPELTELRRKLGSNLKVKLRVDESILDQSRFGAALVAMTVGVRASSEAGGSSRGRCSLNSSPEMVLACASAVQGNGRGSRSIPSKGARTMRVVAACSTCSRREEDQLIRRYGLPLPRGWLHGDAPCHGCGVDRGLRIAPPGNLGQKRGPAHLRLWRGVRLRSWALCLTSPPDELECGPTGVFHASCAFGPRATISLRHTSNSGDRSSLAFFRLKESHLVHRRARSAALRS